MGHGASIDMANISPEEAKKLLSELDDGKGNDEDRSGGAVGTETSTRSKRVRQQKNIFSEVRANGSLVSLLVHLFVHFITLLVTHNAPT